MELRMVRPGGRLSRQRIGHRRSMITVAKSNGRALLASLGLVAIALVCGCARSVQSTDAARQAFYAGKLHEAAEKLQSLSADGGGDADAAELDLAIVEMATGDVAAAESRLRRLRDRFDALPQTAPLREAASMVTDDTARLYRPADYEQVMVRSMLAVCSLAGDRVDAESYALQATTKQAELGRLAKQRGMLDVDRVYQPIAFAPYLRGMLREATHHDYDDATREYRLVSSVRPQFAPAQADIARASEGVHSAPGHGVLYVIACVGQGPLLRETTAPTTSTALAIASSVLNAETNREDSADGRRTDGPVLPNIASVKVPEVVVPASQIAAIGVRIEGNLYGATQTLTDVGELAIHQLSSEMPWTIARAVVRRATKEAAVAKAGDAIGLSGTAGSLFHFAAASAWSGVERADIRCWGLLPREIQVFRVELPAGRHAIDLQPLGFHGQALSAGHSVIANIVDGRNQYLFAFSPGPAMYVVSPPTDQP